MTVKADPEDVIYVHECETLESMPQLPGYSAGDHLESGGCSRPPENASQLEIDEVFGQEHPEEPNVFGPER